MKLSTYVDTASARRQAGPLRTGCGSVTTAIPSDTSCRGKIHEKHLRERLVFRPVARRHFCSVCLGVRLEWSHGPRVDVGVNRMSCSMTREREIEQLRRELAELEGGLFAEEQQWQEVPQALFLSWSYPRQLAYCAARDEATARELPEDAEWYLARAARYKEMLRHALSESDQLPEHHSS